MFSLAKGARCEVRLKLRIQHRRSPSYHVFAGLDISVKTTAICVSDAHGRILLETMVDSAPEAIADRLRELDQPFERIGLEAGPLSQWIYAGLVDVGLAAICVETRHMRARSRHGSTRPTGTTPVESPR